MFQHFFGIGKIYRLYVPETRKDASFLNHTSEYFNYIEKMLEQLEQTAAQNKVYICLRDTQVPRRS